MIDRNTQLAFKVHDSAFKYRGGVIPQSVVEANLKRVEYSETEGFQCWFDDNKYPVNGFFDPYAQAAADPVKRYLRNELKLTSKHPTRALAYLSKRFRDEWVYEFAEFCHMNFRGHVYEENHWVRAVKEIRQASVGIHTWIIEGLSVFLEHDRPYRYRMQDVLGCLDHETLNKNPLTEIKRLLDMFVKRDHARDWTTISKLIGYMLWLPMVKNSIVKVLKRIDPITIALDTTDLYNCLLSDCQDGENRYHYLGLDNEGMTKLHMAINV